ncbi:MAG TPA: RNA-binding protein [Bryobacteraceae bacterium]|nr:RNA-binding protein [Bryobacteraceae bacterium]
MSFTVFLGNLPTWVTKDDILAWLRAESLVADDVKVIRNPETQESKGFAFIDAPNQEEMDSIIRRFDRAPLEDRILRANPAQPPRPKGARPSFTPAPAPSHSPAVSVTAAANSSVTPSSAAANILNNANNADRPKRGGKKHKKGRSPVPQSAFAEELAKAL